MKQNLTFFAFSVGVFSPNYFPVLPSLAFVLMACLFSAAIFYRVRQAWIISLALGLTWGACQATTLANQLLSDSLDSELFIAKAEIVEIDNENSWQRPQRAEIEIKELSHLGSVLEDYPQKALVSWYGKATLAKGDFLTAEMKLRRPRGLNNPGLFDYQKWLVANQFGATGYIREIEDHRNTQPNQIDLDNWRDDIASLIQASDALSYPGIHQALVLGDGSELSDETWELLRGTGTIHLMVISGLHVGLVAAMGYFIAFNFGRLLSPILGINAVRIAIVGACGSALVYSLISGFGLPSQRAFLMLLGILVPRFLFYRTSRWFGLSLALALIAAFEPNAVLQTGFWLSFGAVVILFLGFGSSGKQNYLIGLVRTQVLFVTGFFGVLLWQGIDLPTASFFANLIAVPIVGLCLVPLEILALMMTPFSEPIAVKVWLVCDYLVRITLDLLSYIRALNIPDFVRPANWSAVHSLAAVSAFLIWALQDWRLRLALAIGCLPLIFPARPEQYLLRIHVFDVGQGQAVLVQQPGYNLLYDTGLKFSERFDSGADIIVPTLRQMRVPSLDRVVVSHPDSDHLGGAEGVLSSIEVDRLDVGKAFAFSESFELAGGYSQKPNVEQTHCEMGQFWDVRDVQYAYLWPDGELRDNNDSSCVLTISVDDIYVVIPGDISAPIEKQLVSKNDLHPADLVVIPHHGSKTSSSSSFVEALNPAIAIASAGYKNQFNHPHPDVVKRYEDTGSLVMNTASDGAIEVTWYSDNEPPEVKKASDSKIFWWQK